jgi:addiction module HigA family antidote
MIPEKREPASPGEILRQEFLGPLGMSEKELAARMKVPLQHVNEIISGKRGITAETAVLLAGVFESSPEFWMNLQTALDLYRANAKRAAGRPPSVRGSGRKPKAR